MQYYYGEWCCGICFPEHSQASDGAIIITGCRMFIGSTRSMRQLRLRRGVCSIVIEFVRGSGAETFIDFIEIGRMCSEREAYMFSVQDRYFTVVYRSIYGKANTRNGLGKNFTQRKRNILRQH